MSFYTQFKIKLKLKSDTPQKILDSLEYAFNGKYESEDSDEDSTKYLKDLFGAHSKIPDVFLASRVFPMLGGSFNEISYDDGQCSIVLDTDFQNRDEEINKFLNFIVKYVDGTSLRDGKKVGSIETETGDYRDITVTKNKRGTIAFKLDERNET